MSENEKAVKVYENARDEYNLLVGAFASKTEKQAHALYRDMLKNAPSTARGYGI